MDFLLFFQIEQMTIPALPGVVYNIVYKVKEPPYRTIAAKIGLVVPGKYIARSESVLLCEKLQEMKEIYSHFE